MLMAVGGRIADLALVVMLPFGVGLDSALVAASRRYSGLIAGK